MEEGRPGLRRAFLRSAPHAWLALLSLGAGFAASSPGNPIPLLLGAAAYAIGWIYLPDMPWFRRRLEARRESARKAAEELEIAAFVARRDALVTGLSLARRARYEALLQVCKDIERAAEESPIAADVRLKKLEELAWAYLRLLSIAEAQERFLESERREDLPGEITTVEAEAARLSAECEALRAERAPGGSSSRLEARQRLLDSCRERLEILRRRHERTENARENLKLLTSEQDRLVQQIKLIRADAVATRNMEALSSRIDAAVVHLDETNRWIAGLEEFQDLVGELPATERRAGFESRPPTEPAQTRGGRRKAAKEGGTG